MTAALHNAGSDNIQTNYKLRKSLLLTASSMNNNTKPEIPMIP